MSLNKVILIGNLGVDPEIRAIDNGIKVATFRIATTESYNDRNSGERKNITEWHNIVLWRGLADIAEKYLNKGSKIYLEGKLRTRSWTNTEQVTKYITEIIGDKLIMLDKKENSKFDNKNLSNNVTINEEFEIDNDDEGDLPF